MVILARESRGLTQRELSLRVGRTQGYVSKLESGLLPIADEILPDLSRALDYPESFFQIDERVMGYGTPCLYHRKQRSIPIPVLRRLQALANVVRLQVKNMSRGIEIENETDIPSLDVDEYGSPEAIAGLVRRYWRMPLGPVRDLTRIIESAGGIVIRLAFGTRQLDAVSMWAPGEAPLFLVNEDSPWDRLRFTLAHEIGHMVMHRVLTPDMESEADQFAAEFLMPSDVITPELSGLRLDSLAILKQRWRVSMQALIRKAYALQCITKDQYRRLFTRMSKLGYRLREPNPIPPEDPTVLREVVAVQMRENGLTLHDLAVLACSSERDMRDRFLGHHLRVIA